MSAKKRSFWALSDQAVSSIGNFLTAVYLARVLGTAEYGVFALLYGSIVLANSLHAGLVMYPMQVLAARDDTRAGLVFRAGMRLTLITSVPCASIVAALTFAVGRPALFGSVFFATLAWQLQETARRALLAELRFQDAFIGDCASYLGQTLVIFLLAKSNLGGLRLIFWIVGLTSLAALGLQLVQLRPSFRKQARRVRYQEFWELGSWAVLTNVAGMLPTVQGLLWIANIGAGPIAAGTLQIVANSTGVLHPLLFTLGNLLVPAIANAEAEGGLKSARLTAVRYASIFGAMVVPYVAILLVAPGLVFRVLYGNRAPIPGFEFVMRFFAAAYLAIFGAQILGAWLRARTLPKQDFIANLFAAFVILSLGLPLTHFMGVKGAAIAFFVSCLVRLAYQSVCVNMRAGSPAGATLAAGAV